MEIAQGTKQAPPQGRRRAFQLLLALLVVILVENAAAWAYVAKRAMASQPFTDLLVQYYALKPVARLFPEQFAFPREWWSLYAGDMEDPTTPSRWWVGDPLLGHRIAKDIVVSENIWSYRRSNAQGFVITEAAAPIYDEAPAADVFRIIVLGGSTVEGNGASGSLTALPAALLDLLQREYAPALGGATRFEVINAGVSGYTSVNELLYYLSELQRFHPHLVISYGGWNDHQVGNMLLAQYGPPTPLLATSEYWAFTDIINGHFQWAPSARNLLERSGIAVMRLGRGLALIDATARLTAKLGLANWWATAADPGASLADYYSPQSVVRYGERVRVLNSVVRGGGAQHAWFLQPIVGVGNHPPAPGREAGYIATFPLRTQNRQAFYAAARQVMATLQGELGEAGLCAAEVSDVFDGNPTHVYDDPGHLNDEGNRIVAVRIVRELQRCGMVRRKP
jgi:hypothetical protein